MGAYGIRPPTQSIGTEIREWAQRRRKKKKKLDGVVLLPQMTCFDLICQS